MDLQLTDQVAIVTGSSKGLGLASARALAAEGVSELVLKTPNAPTGLTVAPPTVTQNQDITGAATGAGRDQGRSVSAAYARSKASR